MRNRWSLFLSGFVVLVTWYVIAYVVTSGTFSGLTIGLGFALAAVGAGLFFGAAAGVATRALELHLLHMEVRRGDARGGARVTLGRLPEIVPVARHDDSANAPEPAAEPAATEPPTASKPVPVPAPDPLPESDDSGARGSNTDSANAGAPGPTTATGNAGNCNRLAIACGRFVAAHKAVALTPNADGHGTAASIDRAANPDAFGAFMALISTLAGEGVDVSPVAVSAGPDGLPASVTFPVSK